MSNPTMLKHLSDEVTSFGHEMKAKRRVKSSANSNGSTEMMSDTSSISEAPTRSTRNELSEMLSKIRFSRPSMTPTLSESNNSKRSVTPTEIRQANHMLSHIQKTTDRVSNNILMYVKYLSSPLRLYLKTMLQLMTPEDRIAHAASIKVAERVKEDLVSDWNNKDSFGLKILVKMYRMYTNVLPMFRDHEDFLRYLKPNYAKDAETRAHITYYLYNYVMNPGVAAHPNGRVSLEHDVHSYFDKFLEDEKDDISAVGFDVQDFRDQLRIKLVFELNMYMASAFKKPLHFKHKPHPEAALKEEKLHPEEVIQRLFQMFSSAPIATVFAEQMMNWMTMDDDLSAPVRGYKGGKAKKKSRKV